MSKSKWIVWLQINEGENEGKHIINDDDDASPIPSGDGSEPPPFSHIMFEDAAKITLEITLPYLEENIFTLSEVQYKLCIKKGKVR